MKTHRPYLRFGIPPQDVTLDAGEAEAIAMSLEWPADLLIMDESSGRAMARNLNIRITGTLGVLLRAKRDGQIPSLKSEMDRLVQNAGFFVSDRVRNTFFAEGEESVKTTYQERDRLRLLVQFRKGSTRALACGFQRPR